MPKYGVLTKVLLLLFTREPHTFVPKAGLCCFGVLLYVGAFLFVFPRLLSKVVFPGLSTFSVTRVKCIINFTHTINPDLFHWNKSTIETLGSLLKCVQYLFSSLELESFLFISATEHIRYWVFKVFWLNLFHSGDQLKQMTTRTINIITLIMLDCDFFSHCDEKNTVLWFSLYASWTLTKVFAEKSFFCFFYQQKKSLPCSFWQTINHKTKRMPFHTWAWTLAILMHAPDVVKQICKMSRFV